MKFSDMIVKEEKIERPVKIVNGEVVLPDEEEEEEDDDTVEQDLTDALSLLADCNTILELMSDEVAYPEVARALDRYTYMKEEIKRTAQEVLVFTSQYQG